MPDDPIAEGPVSRAELEELAVLFDHWEYALDPMAVSAKEARVRFEERVSELFGRVRLLPEYQSVDAFVFKNKLRSLCRQYLRKNQRP